MYSSFRFITKYIRYYISALNGKGHGIHSPFVYEWVDKIQNDGTKYADYIPIESCRNSLLRNDTWIHVEDFGAGSGGFKSSSRKVSAIARKSLKSPKYAQLLYRIVRHYKPVVILELGTSLGITSAYLSKANPQGKVYTFEGAPEVSKTALDQFGILDLKNIELVLGNMDQTLDITLQQINLVDFVFIDGNHRKEAVISYFNLLLAKSGPATIMVFDDIHWSEEMEHAWGIIKSDHRVKLSIDLFFIGIVFLKEEFLVKQDFVIRF